MTLHSSAVSTSNFGAPLFRTQPPAMRPLQIYTPSVRTPHNVPVVFNTR